MTATATDIVFSVDLSGSYWNELPELQNKIATTMTRLINPNLSPVVGDDVNFGITSFVDKPFSPFGGPDDYVYKRERALTADISSVQNVVNSLSIQWGDNYEEAQLDALAHTALDSSLGWRTGSSRIVIIATDSPYQEAGDGSGSGLIPNNGDSIVDDDEDYWAVSQVKTVIENENIIPIFIVNGISGVPINPGDPTTYVKSSYDQLVTELGRGLVLDFDDDSENISDAIKYAVAQANGTITITTTQGGDPIGDGDDVITLPTGATGDQVVFAGGGNDSVFLTSSTANNYIDGGAGYDVLYGGIGQDTTDGGTSDDNLNGGAGNDVLFGSSGNDYLSGGAGNDYLQGDSGNDVLVGGAGADKFGFATGTKFDINDLNVDTILDFNASQGDTIQLSQYTFDDLSSPVGTLDPSDFGTNINYDNSTGFLSYLGTHFATFVGMPTLTASNFEVVDF